MRVHPRVRLMAGIFAMAGAVLLSAPGVRVAAAGENAKASAPIEKASSETPKPADALACDPASGEAAETPATASTTFDPVRQQDIVVLNNRGYNYAGGQPFSIGSEARPQPQQ
jgi:hypothetical protein